MELRGKLFTEEEFQTKIHGISNSSIINYLADWHITKENSADIAIKKEKIYRELCIANPDKFRLIAGAEEFLDYLKSREIPCAIATASDIVNVEFYVDQLDLRRWFTSDKIVYDDFSFQGKPAPDFYLTASKRLGLSPGECVVFEDSPAGLKSADNAGIGMIIALNASKVTDLKKYSLRIDLVIRDFTEINGALLFE